MATARSGDVDDFRTGAAASFEANSGEVVGGDREKESFHTWAWKNWERIDRDKSGFITREELNCDEFQKILKSVLVPQTTESRSEALARRGGDDAQPTARSSQQQLRSTGVASYARSEMHVTQAINFCLRKADQNYDGRLSFREFKAFLRELRCQGQARNRANLIFALFDLDGTNTIDKDEFREIFRYFHGRHATADEIAAEWQKLDPRDTGEATRADYTRWLRRAADPVFRQLAPVPADGDDEDDDDESCGRSSMGTQVSHAALQLLHKRRQRKRVQGLVQSEWNAHFNSKDTSLVNEASVKNERKYFSRPQSLPELSRYCDRHAGRLEGLKKVLADPPEKRRSGVLSTDTPALPSYLPGRHVPGGTMRKGRQLVEWNNDWQPPGEFGPAGRFKPRPGSLLLRCSGRAPSWALLGKDYEE